jgi:branched-chain amino acid aminotransferase
MIRIWKITTKAIEELSFQDTTSLDTITRQLPEGYYSTFRTYDGCRRVLGLAAHLQRLYEPVPSPEVSATALCWQLRMLLEPYLPNEARVRLVMTKPGQAYIAIEPLKLLPPEVYEKGVHVETTDIRREAPRLKSTAFISASGEERKHIAQEGIFEALLVKDGKIMEGMTSNFFYVEQFGNLPSIGTAREDVLLGVTRKTVIEVARAKGLEVRYKPVKRIELNDVAETFITSSSRGVVPVIQIDDVLIGNGKPGPITKELIAGYEAYVLEKAEPI